jgi:protein SCO1/2
VARADRFFYLFTAALGDHGPGQASLLIPSEKSPKMKTKIFPLILIFFCIFSGFSFWLWTSPNKHFSSAPDYGTVPDFSFTERSGKLVTLSDLKGKIWVADFIFTSCSGPCPIMSAQMAEVQKGLDGTDNVKLVSISVDPKRDTPEVLKKYSDQFGATDKWFFVTGKDEDIQRLAKKGFKLAAGEDPLIHSTRFILVDRNGKIFGYYDSNDEGVVKNILKDIRKLN